MSIVVLVGKYKILSIKRPAVAVRIAIDRIAPEPNHNHPIQMERHGKIRTARHRGRIIVCPAAEEVQA